MYLTNKGADIGAIDNEGWKLLDIAIKNGCTKIMKFLHDKGAKSTYADNQETANLKKRKANVIDIADKYPLHTAAKNGNKTQARILIEQGVSVNSFDQYRRTPLHFAAYKGKLEMVKYLIEEQANVNVVDQFGNTPLYWAIVNCDQKMVDYLIKNGAYVSETLLNTARERGNTEMAEYLEKSGAYLNETLLNAKEENSAEMPARSVSSLEMVNVGDKKKSRN